MIAGTSVTEIMAVPISGEGLGEGERMKKLAFLAGERKDGRNDSTMMTRRRRSAAHLAASGGDYSVVSPVILFSPKAKVSGEWSFPASQIA